MLLPFFGWAATGLVFFLKPGYAGAYELLQPKTYPLERQVSITPDPSWLEMRYLRTVLGDHLIVRTVKGWQHLDPTTLAPKEKPSPDDVRRLMDDAFSQNPTRYGQITEVTGETVATTTNVRVTLNWNRLSLQQSGKDTDLIDRLYKIHYLQWTGVKWIDQVLGVAGLILIAALSVLGLILAFNLNLMSLSAAKCSKGE